MSIRLQTVALFALLGGVVLLALLHHGAGPLLKGRPAYYEQTPAELATTFALLKSPKGFVRTTVHCVPDEGCFQHLPSMILSAALVERWATEAGLTVDRRRTTGMCSSPRRARRTRLMLMACGGVVAHRGKVVFAALANSIVLDGPHGIRATNARIDAFQGTELKLIDFGVPTAQTIREEQLEAASEHA